MPLLDEMTQEMVDQLSQELDQSRVKSRTESGQTLSYLEAWDVIDKANEIFGFDGWTTEIVKVEAQKLGAMAVVRVRVAGIVREDVGFNAYAVSGDNPPTKKAMDTSLKGAVSDALKRALRTFGDQFGNDLYDKESENRVNNQQGSGQRRQQGNQQQQRQQSNQQRQQPQSGGQQQRRPAQQQERNQIREFGVAVDDSGNEILTKKAAGFKQHVENHGLNWQWFLSEILETNTLLAYFESGGSPRGALGALNRYADDNGLSVSA